MTLPDRTYGNVYYPETDGEPMAETDTHRDIMMDLISELTEFYKDNPIVYVSGNLLLYYREGDPKKSLSPDVFVVKGIEKKKRPIYKLWEEGKMPDVVIEITSKTTRHEDLRNKKGLYEVLGVKEYFIFDPFSEYLNPNLKGYRRTGDKFHPIQGRIISEILGLELIVEEESLRLGEIFSRKKLLTPRETARAKEEAEVALLQAETKLIQKETQLLEKETHLMQVETKRVEAEAKALEAEQARNEERAAREKLEEEVTRLREVLHSSGIEV